MKLQRIKKAQELPQSGDVLVHSELNTVDGSIKSVVLKFKSGKLIKAGIESYNELHLTRQADPEIVKKHRVSTVLAGTDVTRDFDDEYEAKEYKRKLEAETRGTEVQLTEVEVEADDVPKVKELDNSIPF